MDKDKDIKSRINKLIQDSGGNQSEFARTLNLKPSHLSMILSSRDTGISATVLKNFADIGVNLNWLMQGKGEVWQKDLEINSVLQAKITDMTAELAKATAVIEFTERVLKGTQNNK